MKILIISHNCFSSTQSMGKTLASLLSAFPKSDLMQLYLYPTLPNIDVCSDYYRITDSDAIKAILHRKKCGRKIGQNEIHLSNELFDSADNQKTYEAVNRNSRFLRSIRDIVWRIAGWKTQELKNWLVEGNPDAVFYALGDATFSQDIAIWASDFLGIPLVTYVCDEFYFYYKNNTQFSTRLLCKALVKKIEKTMKKSALMVSICNDLGELYHSKFGVPYTTIMTASSFPAGSLTRNADSKTISYIGNLSLNRWKSLVDIANVLSELNEMLNAAYQLCYYGMENEHLNGIVEYGGFLDSHQVQRKMSESLALVHVETFDAQYYDLLKYSVSTKLADSLASGTCILVYAPKGLASVEHLQENHCAFIAYTKAELKERLLQVLEKPNHRETVIQNALTTAKNDHEVEKNSRTLFEMFALLFEKDFVKR